MTYSGLGHLVHSVFKQWFKVAFCPGSSYTNDESFKDDALGNRLWSTSTETVGSGQCYSQDTSGTNSHYAATTGRLDTENVHGFTTSFVYDSSGAIEFSQNLGTPSREQASYYAPDGTLRATDTRNASEFHNAPYWSRAFDEYRYDALGRRIWMRSQKSCVSSGQNFVANTECQTSIVRRIIWDGSDILAEIQMPGGSGDGSQWENDVNPVTLPPADVSGGLGDPSRYFGRVIYAHAFGTDKPVAVTRYNYVRAVDNQGNQISPDKVIPWARFMPFWNLLGDADLNAFAAGDSVYCEGPTNQCEGVFSPSTWAAYNREHGSYSRNNWQGSLLENGQDKSGLQFRRNRYYDPVTGRFTQEDPIGLAGGLNLYGFAKGDPVNFSDPFGLCEKPQGKGVGICLESYIRGKFFGYGDNRGPSANGGTYKTSTRFSIDPASGSISGLQNDIGYTGGKKGMGGLDVTRVSDGNGGWNLTLTGSAVNGTGRGAMIDYNINLHVDKDGGVTTAGGAHDGFPSYEIWVYKPGTDPSLLYDHNQGSRINFLKLFGSSDTKVP